MLVNPVTSITLSVIYESLQLHLAPDQEWLGKCPPPLVLLHFFCLSLRDRLLFHCLLQQNFMNQKMDEAQIDAGAHIPPNEKLKPMPPSSALSRCHRLSNYNS